MSYILDALRRVETEKDKGILPIPQNVRGEAPRRIHVPRITRRVMIGCILVLALLTAIGVYFRTTREAPMSPQPKSTPIVLAPLPPTQPQVNEVPVAPLPVPSAPAPPLKTEPPKDKEQREVPQLIEMPQSFQQSIPPLQFRGHFYSTDPQNGSVVIGEKIYPVGAEVAPGVTLEEVTPTGVILNTRNTHFRIEVLGNWVY